MIVVGVAVAAVAAFVLSSVYYVAMLPWERRHLGDRAVERGRPAPVKVATELVRTAIVATIFAWVASRAGLLSLPESLALAAMLWVGFPLVLLSGSVLWERVSPFTAAVHAGDWLLKLFLIAVVVAALH